MTKYEFIQIKKAVILFIHQSVDYCLMQQQQKTALQLKTFFHYLPDYFLKKREMIPLT